MKYFLIKGTLFLTAIFTTVGSVNYFGDAANLFDQNYEKKIAEILQSGKNVTNISNYDERLLQKILIRDLDTITEMVVLGSSRAMLIGEETFKVSNIRNSSVSGASLEDLVGIYQLYKTENILPEKILIGIDPWIFNSNNGQNRWQTLSTEYCAFLNIACKNEAKYFKFQQIISPSYFQSSFENLLKQSTEPQATLEYYNESNTKLIDGSLVYNKAMREKNNDQILNSIESYQQGDIYSLNNFNKLSPKYIEEFKILINDMMNAGVIVEFVLIPYPPQVYNVLVNDYRVIIAVENFVRQYAENLKIEIKGSYDPSKYNLKNIDFYDGMHLKQEKIRGILR